MFTINFQIRKKICQKSDNSHSEMNSPNQRDLFELFDQMQKDQPLGKLVGRYVDQMVKKHAIPTEKKSKKKREKSKKKEKNLKEQN